MEIGKLVKEAFFSRPGAYARKVMQTEEGVGTIRVLAYPDFFMKKVDEIVTQFYKQ